MKTGCSGILAGLLIVMGWLVMPLQAQAPAQPAAAMSESQTLQLFSSLFGKRYAEVQQTTDAGDDAELVKLIVDSADQLKDNPVFQRFCYERAIALAGDQPEAVDPAIAATQHLIEMKVDPVKWSQKLVDLYQLKYRFAPAGDRTQVAGKLVQAIKDAGQLLQSLRRSNEAISIYKLALPYAREVGSTATDTAGGWISDARAQAQIDAQVAALEAKMAGEPSADTAGQLIHLLIRHYDDATGARKWLAAANDPQLTQRVNLLSRDPEKVSSEDLLDLGLWWKSLVSEVTGGRQRALLVHAQQACQIAADRKDLTGINQIKVNLTLQEVTAAIEKIDNAQSQSADNAKGSGPYRIVIWNQHNANYNDRGTKKINLRLYYHDREVYVKTGIPIPWSPDADEKTVIAPPAKSIDRVRVEITEWVGNGGGFSEIQVYMGSTLISQSKPTQASARYPLANYPTGQVVDGITTSATHGKGYWILPDKTPGWIDVYLSGQPPK